MALGCLASEARCNKDENEYDVAAANIRLNAMNFIIEARITIIIFL